MNCIEKLDSDLKKIILVAYRMLDFKKNIEVFLTSFNELKKKCGSAKRELNTINKIRDDIKKLIQRVNDDTIKFNILIADINLIKLPDILIPAMFPERMKEELNNIGFNLNHIKKLCDNLIIDLDKLDAFKKRFGTQEDMLNEWFDKNDSIY